MSELPVVASFRRRLARCARSATARQLDLSWSEADGIMQRAVDRGLARRPATTAPVLGVDEKSFQGREFVTVVCDLDRGTVLHVADGRGSAASLKNAQSIARSRSPVRFSIPALD